VSPRRKTAPPPAYAGTPRGEVPIDHPEYARRTLDELKRYWGMARLESESFLKVWDEVRPAAIWKRWPVEHPYGSLAALCQAELGQPVKGVRQALAEARAVTARPLKRVGRPADQNGKGDNITFSRGTGADYLVARLARDYPEYLERLQQGEYRSVRAAAKAAGMPMKERVQFEPTINNFERFIRKHLSSEEIRALVLALGVK